MHWQVANDFIVFNINGWGVFITEECAKKTFSMGGSSLVKWFKLSLVVCSLLKHLNIFSEDEGVIIFLRRSSSAWTTLTWLSGMQTIHVWRITPLLPSLFVPGTTFMTLSRKISAHFCKLVKQDIWKTNEKKHPPLSESGTAQLAWIWTLRHIRSS